MTSPASQFLIYGLRDPQDGIRYVGRSCSGLTRPHDHARPGYLRREKNTAKRRWIEGLTARGAAYEVVVLEEVTSSEELSDREIAWIAEGRRLGWPLLNRTPGGEGVPLGFRFSKERNKRISASCLGRVHSPETRAKISATKTGVKRSPEAVERSASKLRGVRRSPRPPEVRAKIAASLRGFKQTEETRKKRIETYRRKAER